MNHTTGKRPLIKLAVGAVGAVLALAAFTGARAQVTGYPSKPIRIVIPYAPGGTTDILGRRLAQRLSEVLGQPVIADNRAGGNTAIGTEAVAKSAADGYTLLFTNDATFVVNPVLFPALSYNMQRDFLPVASVAYAALALVVNASTPANNMKELVAYTKGRKDLAYGSFGAGSQPHLMGEMYKQLTGSDMVHVAYKGAGPAVTDVLGGQVLFTFPAYPTIQGHVAAGKLKVLGVSGDKRLVAAPHVPTFTEAGFKDMDIGGWYALFAPIGTPRDVVAKLNGTVASILAEREFSDKNITNVGMSVLVHTPEQMPGLIKSETERMTAIVKKSGAKVE